MKKVKTKEKVEMTNQQKAEHFLELIWNNDYIKAHRFLCYDLIDATSLSGVKSEHYIAQNYQLVMGKQFNYSTIYNFTQSVATRISNNKKTVKGNVNTLIELIKFAQTKFGNEIHFEEVKTTENMKAFLLHNFWKGNIDFILKSLFQKSEKGQHRNDSFFANYKSGKNKLDTTGKLFKYMNDNVFLGEKPPTEQTLRNVFLGSKSDISLSTFYYILQTAKIAKYNCTMTE